MAREILELHGPWFRHPDGRWVDAKDLPKESEMTEHVEAAVTGDLQTALDRAQARSNELYRMVKFLHDHQDECIGDHPDWLAGMNKLLDGEHFDALTELKHIFGGLSRAEQDYLQDIEERAQAPDPSTVVGGPSRG